MKKYKFKLPTIKDVKKVDVEAGDEELRIKFEFHDTSNKLLPNEFLYDRESKRYYAVLGNT